MIYTSKIVGANPHVRPYAHNVMSQRSGDIFVSKYFFQYSCSAMPSNTPMPRGYATTPHMIIPPLKPNCHVVMK